MLLKTSHKQFITISQYFKSYFYFNLKIIILKNAIFISLDRGKSEHSIDVKFIFLRLFETSFFTSENGKLF